MTCMWLLSDDLMPSTVKHWMKSKGIDKAPNSKKYLTSLYFVITTATTVGYGDITISNDLERVFAMLFMITGQIGLTYAISLLGTILSNWNYESSNLQEKIGVLNNIYRDYKLPLDLYTRLKQNLKFTNEQDIEDLV